MDAAPGAKTGSNLPSQPDAIKVASVSDQPTLADSLGFQPYVRAIVKFLSWEGPLGGTRAPGVLVGRHDSTLPIWHGFEAP